MSLLYYEKFTRDLQSNYDFSVAKFHLSTHNFGEQIFYNKTFIQLIISIPETIRGKL